MARLAARLCRPKGRRYKGPARALTKNLSFHTDSSGAASPGFTPANVPTFQVLLGGEHEDAILAGEAHLLQFSVGPEKDGIVASFLSALFPVSRHFGHELVVLLNCDFGAIDEQAPNDTQSFVRPTAREFLLVLAPRLPPRGF